MLRGDLAKARQSFQQLLPICEANGYHWLVGQCLFSLAHAYADNSEFSKAIGYSSRGLEKFKQFQDLNGEVKTLTQLAAHSQKLAEQDIPSRPVMMSINETSELGKTEAFRI